MTDRVMVSFRIPKDLRDKVDARAKAKGLTRTEWFERMTRWVLTNKTLR